MQKVYFISGLGADERAFEYLDLSFCEPVFIKWIKPDPRESISHYSLRIFQQIKDPAATIVGLSFGGMIAIELSKIYSSLKIILISSAKTRSELPFHFRLLRYLPLHKLVKPSMMKRMNSFAYQLMGVSKRADKILFTKMLNEANDDFISWAVNAIVNWPNREAGTDVTHIHGRGDYILPYFFIKANYEVKKGDHLMLMSMPHKISQLLKAIIAGEMNEEQQDSKASQ